MLTSTVTFLRQSLVPTKQALRLRLAPLHAYMLASLILTLLVTLVDYILLQPEFFAPMWLFLHGFAIFFFYMITVAFTAIYVQLVTKVRQGKAWPYRQAWPYAVAMTIVPMFLVIVLYHASPQWSVVGFGLIVFYVTYPLFHAPVKNKRQPRPR
ncbi:MULTISPECIES: hypothetical protein [Exiguobacterium]|uniref:hypothetical protein n=1 Tax=Exiguobacterium TaxID=33986 RepID=UPI0020370C4A|nr:MULTISPECIES: hypothetical protein [Exiguobacterium]MCT4782619.1 hypothetical protein [Exiguobacterium himgiriensis]